MNILKPFMALCLMQALPCTVRAAQPDSVYVFPLSHDQRPRTARHAVRLGADGEHWQDVAEGMVFMRCDFGAWKYMYRPRLIQDRQDGRLHCFWDLDPEGSAIGYASSTDLIKWTPQEYFMATEQGKFAVKDGRMPVAGHGANRRQDDRGVRPESILRHIGGMERHGIYRSALNAQRGRACRARRGPVCRTANGQCADYRGRKANGKPISENLIGVFFEDLNYAADGGTMPNWCRTGISNTSRGNKDRTGTVALRVGVEGEGMALTCLRDQPVHPNNPHYAVLNVAHRRRLHEYGDSTASR